MQDFLAVVNTAGREFPGQGDSLRTGVSCRCGGRHAPLLRAADHAQQARTVPTAGGEAFSWFLGNKVGRFLYSCVLVSLL